MSFKLFNSLWPIRFKDAEMVFTENLLLKLFIENSSGSRTTGALCDALENEMV